jgi:predicted TIM-barrel fold metal-dependent hydrolase
MAIDLHGHCTPMPYIEALSRRDAFPRAEAAGDGYRIEVGGQAAFRAAPLHWDLAARIPALDAEGVTRQALSLSAAYGFDLLGGGEAVTVADAVNDAILAAAKPFGERFVPLAVAPVDGSGTGLPVLGRALAAGHRGMILSSSVVAALEDDAVLAPYLRAIAEAGGFVLVHPGSRVETRGLPGAFAFSLNTAGFQNELTVALFRLVFGGLLDAVPGLPVVFVNLGGAAPLLGERMRTMWEGRAAPGETPPDDGFRRVFYDFSSFREHSLAAAVAVLGADRLVLGTDYPIQGLERPLRVLGAASLDEDTRAAIREGNAAAILSGRAAMPAAD